MATQAEVAGHLDMTRAAVADLIQRGILPKAEKRQLDLDACRRAYINHLRNQAAGRHGGGGQLEHWRTELAREKATEAKRANELAEGKIIPQEQAVRAWQIVLGQVRAKFLGIPTKAAPLLAAMGGKPAAIKERLTELIHECLEDAAAADPFAGADSVRGGDRGGANGAADPEAAAETDDQRVGGGEPPAQPGKQRGAG